MADNEQPQYLGARFYKCALQVNPHAYMLQYQPKSEWAKVDEDEYNQAMLEACHKNNIEVVGLADHNNVKSSETLRQLLSDGGITVFPGFEIESDGGIHMVCLYCEKTTADDLHHNLLTLLGDNKNRWEEYPPIASSKSGQDIAKLINGQNGFFFAAHMTQRNGILEGVGTASNHKEFWQDARLIAGQIPRKLEDLEDNHKNIIENKDDNYKRKKKIVVINAKDSDPDTLEDTSASVQIKMTNPGLEAFKDAFYDSESRVRLNYDVQESHHSKIISISWEGGDLLRNSAIKLSENLNAVIGGHGSGKSTLLESIRYALDLRPKFDGADKDHKNLCASNLKNTKITLKIRSKRLLGNIFTISRRYGEPPQIRDSEGNIKEMSTHDLLPDIEIYSQSEILNIANSSADQRKLLNRFLPDQNAKEKHTQKIKERLENNRQKLADAYKKRDELESDISQLKSLNVKADAFEKAGIKDKLKIMGLLNKEKNIISSANSQLVDVTRWAGDYSNFFELDFISARTTENMPNKELLQSARDVLEELRRFCDSHVEEINKKIKSAHKKIKEVETALNKQHSDERNKLQDVLSHLPDYRGESGGDIARQATLLMQSISRIEQQKPRQITINKEIESFEQERRKLLSEFMETAFKKSNEIDEAIRKINKGPLENKVRITLAQMEDKEELKIFLKEIQGIGERMTKWVDDPDMNVTPSNLAETLKQTNATEILSKEYSIPNSVANKIASACGKESEMLMRLEEVELFDKIIIELNIASIEETSKYQPLENLSTGQKCIAILNIILMDNEDPLIMDQPEDNLDNAFIAERIVKDLRNCKDKRQFIFATHNANIPVFGDADLILALVHSDGETHILDKNIGSVDKPAVREAAARILDGGREAFDMRQHKYGFDHD